MKTNSTADKSVNGFINLDKPPEITSMDVVRQIRQATGLKRIGHGGTLDPMATGVIPIAIGAYTRLLEYILDSDKAYKAEIQLGIKTDTFDADGTVIETNDPSNVCINDIEQILPEFTGTFDQTPPLYSAKRVNGKRLYEYARQNIAVEIRSNPGSVKEIQIESFDQPALILSIKCGKGFYVRSLANDLGIRLGCGAYLKSLRRTVSGAFSADKSIPLSDALAIIKSGNLENTISNLDECLPHIPKIHLTERLIKYIQTGRPVTIDETSVQTSEDRSILRVHDNLGELVAIVRFDQETLELKPYKVFLN